MLEARVSPWQRRFSVSKRKVIHTEAEIPSLTYKLMGSVLLLLSQEGDLGVLVVCSVKVSAQYVAAGKKANFVVGVTRKRIKTAEIMQCPLWDTPSSSSHSISRSPCRTGSAQQRVSNGVSGCWITFL